MGMVRERKKRKHGKRNMDAHGKHPGGGSAGEASMDTGGNGIYRSLACLIV